ncbi:sialic acid-binding Ig-like lectin 10 [Rhynchocyon petersi]
MMLLLLPVLWTGSLAQYPEFKVQVQSPVEVQEGLCVLVPCTVTYPRRGWTDSDPAYGYWFLEGTNAPSGDAAATNQPRKAVLERTQGRFQLLGDPRNHSCSLLIKHAKKEDTGMYFFRLERGNFVLFNFKNNMLSLQVTDRTQKPDIYVSETLEPGRPAEAFCVFPGNFEGLQHHNTILTCHVDFSHSVRASSTVRLSVAHAPKNLVLSALQASASDLKPQGSGSSLKVKKGQFLRLLCEADGHPPPTLSWVLNNRVRSWSPPSGPRTLVLERPQVGAEDTGRYTCRAENRLGSQQSWLDLSVQYPPENLRVMVSPANRSVTEILGNGTTLPVLEGQYLRLVCVADSSPPAKLSWDRGSCPLNSSQPSDSEILELPRVQKEDEGEVTCRAQSPLGSQHVTLRLSVLYPPELLGPSCSWEAEGLHCSCSARALPAPSLRWRVGDLLVEGNNSEAAIMVTSTSEGPWANSSLSLREGLSSDLRLHCEARNAHGAHSTTFLLLPDTQGTVSAAFSKGTVLGIGVATFLCLCLMLVLVKTLKRKSTQTATLEPRASRGSSIMDYVNVNPLVSARPPATSLSPLALLQRAGLLWPVPPPWGQQSRRSGGSADALRGSDWQDLSRIEFHAESRRCYSKSPRISKPSTQGPGSTANAEELHYAVVNFLGVRKWSAQEAEDTHTEYAEVKFHQGSAGH